MVVLEGLKLMTVPELFVDIMPVTEPLGSEPLDPGGVELTLMVNWRPVRVTFVPLPEETMFPKLMKLGVSTLLPEPAL